jgi:hypothetical protein
MDKIDVFIYFDGELAFPMPVSKDATLAALRAQEPLAGFLQNKQAKFYIPGGASVRSDTEGLNKISALLDEGNRVDLKTEAKGDAAGRFEDVVGQKRKFERACQAGIEFMAQCKLVNTKTAEFHNLPAYPLLKHTKRARFNVVGKDVPLMHRETSKSMLEFLQKNHGVKPAVYIHGPQGVGKSHSLYDVVCLLRSEPKNRVIYIPDCAGWADYSVNDGPVVLILTAILLAFPDDKDVVDLCDSTKLTLTLEVLIEFLPQYCRKNNFKLYAVFDQHNGLTEDNRKKFPFRIIEADLPSSGEWKDALIVVSASANNSYYLKVASDNEWPEFTITHGYSDEEFDVWVKNEYFFDGDPALKDVRYWTNKIPYELRLVLNAKQENPTASCLEVLEVYKKARENQLRAQQYQFKIEYITKQNMEEQAKRAVVLMELGLSTQGKDFFLNRQLAYVLDYHIYATTPLAREVLISHYSNLEEEINIATKTIFASSEESPDSKGRALERYIIRVIEKLKQITMKIHQINWWTKEQAAYADLKAAERDVNQAELRVERAKEALNKANSKAKKNATKNIEAAQHEIDRAGKICDAAKVKYEQAVKVNDPTKELYLVPGFQLQVADLVVHRFAGDGMPVLNADRKKSYLFVPESFQYPDVDLLLWDAKNEELFPIQVTIKDPLSKHSRNFFVMGAKAKPSAAWSLFLGMADEKAISFVWIATNTDVTQEFHEEYIATINSLDQSIFPLLSYFKK